MKLAEFTEPATGQTLYINPEAVMLVVTAEDGETSNIFLSFVVNQDSTAVNVKGTAAEVKSALGAMAAKRKTKKAEE